MDIRIEKGTMRYLADCEEALVNSELGNRYFDGAGSAKKAVVEGLAEGNLFVALIGGVCVGFMLYLPKGAFHSFPYLHIIAVKEAYRGKGIGGKMLTFLERFVFDNADKLFLVVADFNPGAKRFYERMGYHRVGEIPNLYRMGITECLMMKEK